MTGLEVDGGVEVQPLSTRATYAVTALGLGGE